MTLPSFRALVNDVTQRLLTGNKRNQKSRLNECLDRLSLPSGVRVLDFGCGTALFAPVFTGRGLQYTGYDPDQDLVEYAGIIHPSSRFVNTLEDLSKDRFHLILANCCFHHISTLELHGLLPRIKALLAPEGTFLVIDILAVPNDPSPIHRWFMTLEDGQYVRRRQVLDEIVSSHFTIRHTETYPDTLFGTSISGFPIGNHLVLMELTA